MEIPFFFFAKNEQILSRVNIKTNSNGILAINTRAANEEVLDIKIIITKTQKKMRALVL